MDSDLADSMAAYRAYRRKPASEQRITEFISIVDLLFPVGRVYSATDHLLDQALVANPRLFKENPILFLLYDRPPLELWNTFALSILRPPKLTTKGPHKLSGKEVTQIEDMKNP